MSGSPYGRTVHFFEKIMTYFLSFQTFRFGNADTGIEESLIVIAERLTNLEHLYASYVTDVDVQYVPYAAYGMSHTRNVTKPIYFTKEF